MVRFAKRLLFVVATPILTILLLGIVTWRSGDPSLYPPRSDVDAIPISVVSHGWHVGLVLPVDRLSGLSAGRPGLSSIAGRFASFSAIEIGWGDETFYRFAPEISDVDLGMAYSALFGQSRGSVLHVVGLDMPAHEAFPSGDIVDLKLSTAGFERLADALDASVAVGTGDAVVLGTGLYGPSLFYRARGDYSLLRTCNRWVADALFAAGLPLSPVPGTVAPGLMLELRWRAGGLAVGTD